jgi:hypothetical protein
MKKLLAFMLLGATATGNAGNLQNKDFQAFVKNADNCEHFAGEWDPDQSKQEQRHIERSVVKYCGKAQKQMYALERKYRNDAEIRQMLSEYESVRSYSK